MKKFLAIGLAALGLAAVALTGERMAVSLFLRTCLLSDFIRRHYTGVLLLLRPPAITTTGRVTTIIPGGTIATIIGMMINPEPNTNFARSVRPVTRKTIESLMTILSAALASAMLDSDGLDAQTFDSPECSLITPGARPSHW